MTSGGETISVDFQIGEERAGEVRLVVTLPTFRRPDHLVKTLKTLVSQAPGLPFAILVMENDDEAREGARAARAFLAEHGRDALVIIAHNRGNCHAYNAGFTAALATYPALQAIAVIDDDEIAAPAWLESLVLVQERTGADMVGGPQLPVLDDPSREKWKAHPVFMPHYGTTGPVPILYSSGNVLITRRVLDAMPRPFLDVAFNFIGGGDSDFYRRARERGFTFAWAAEAWVAETVPARRTEPSWIRARSLRNGSISAMLQHKADPSAAGRLKTLGKSVALLAASPLRGLALWRRTGLAAAAPYHFYVALGRLMAEIGRVNEQYRNPEKN
ncbi:glycosyltransferase family 2 protein [Ensifer soli]|uniref:glycosyltransferase family 2 protein n=1 Tax=Ciceribacter sp. sgz301302 TaxID=3342379 RepID=UPI0035B6FF91